MVVLATQTPSIRTLPGPQPSRTVMTTSSGCWRGTGGMACADDARASAKATAISLIICHSPVEVAQSRVAALERQITSHPGTEVFDLDQQVRRVGLSRTQCGDK